MKTQHRTQQQVNAEYINLCFECEIPVKEAVKYGYTLHDLKRQVLVNSESLEYSTNTNTY